MIEDHGGPPKKIEENKLHALLNEDNVQTQEQLAEKFDVEQSAIGGRLKVVRKTFLRLGNVYHMN